MDTQQAVLDRPMPGYQGSSTEGQDWTDRDGYVPEGTGSNGSAERPDGLARALGIFSLGLGVTQLVAPRALGRMIGVGEHPALMRGLGMREITSGVGILSNDRPAEWLWSRVAGDVMDLALLGRALDDEEGDRGRILGAAAAVAGALLIDAYAAQRMSRNPATGAARERESGIRIQHAITIGRPAQELYDFWRDFANLPQIMDHLESVEVLGGNRSRWKVKGPAGSTVEWDAEITEDRPGELIAWRSLEGADVDNVGTVRFIPMPDDRGTVVKIDLAYDPPAGRMGAAVAKLFRRGPEQEIRSDLRPFKQLMETGEITTTRGQSSGRRSPIGKLTESMDR
ncbi:MAG: SRPBCC family protein [Gemmatimonadota bacterium]